MLASGLAVVMLLVVGGAIVFRTMTGNRADPTPGRSPTTDLRPLDSRPLVGWSPLVSVTAPLLPLLPLAPATDAAPEVDPVLIAAAAAAARRDFVEAIRLFLAVTATQPQNPVARDGLRNARADRQEQLARARSLIKLGDLDLEQRRYAEAIGFYNQALLEDGQNAEARVKLGRAQAAKAKADLAATEILGPKQVSSAGTQPNRAALLKQANALLETGFPDRAGAIFDELLKANPADPDALAGKEKTALLRSRQKP
jgi:tetratricopeptide (TPR) repeat protein